MNGIQSKSGYTSLHPWGCLLLLCVQANPLGAAESAKSASTNTAPSGDWLPQEFKVAWQGLPVGSLESVTVEWDGQALQYHRIRGTSPSAQTEERRTLRPTEVIWKEFWGDLRGTDVWEWVEISERQAGTLPERSWKVTMTHDTNRVRAAGSGGYPCLKGQSKSGGDSVLFYRFSHAVDRLVARPVEVEGRYFSGFEVSIFCPSTAAYQGQWWWLTGNRDFYERYKQFYPKDGAAGFGFGGPKVTVRLRGRLAGPGKYGHLDSHTHELFVDEVLDMKSVAEQKVLKP